MITVNSKVIADQVQEADVMFLTSHVFHWVQSERLRMAMWFTIRFLVASFQPILSLITGKRSVFRIHGRFVVRMYTKCLDVLIIR